MLMLLPNRTTTVLVIGLAFHLVYIVSVFDCYFTSPVVRGMQQFRAGWRDEGSVAERTGAKRLVLFVGDGLRADLLFNLNPFPSIPDSPITAAPYLRSIAETRGVFGVSHTRVPTESRPGHVALIGGMYEDVSAVTKGWKTNPVDFDSVFNQSRHTFSFGSPDILPVFARGAVPGRVRTWCYNEDDEDFTRDASELDVWVYNRSQELFGNATSNATLNSQLREGQVVFFFHFLGLDTTGHSYRPHSKEYMHNIQVVDDLVRKTEHLFNEFYDDEETAYVFTADHGMSNIGNHGDGNPDSTRTPLIAWGKSIRSSIPDTTPSSHDDYSRPWGPSLTQLLRVDLEQADVAALMAAVAGVNFPVNSVGVVPDVRGKGVGYLDVGMREKAQVALGNAQSILEHYRVKHNSRSSRMFFYKPYTPLHEDFNRETLPGEVQLSHINASMNNEQWEDALADSLQLIDHSLEGLRYLQTYDRHLLRTIVALGYIGWAAFSASHLFIRQPSSSTLSTKAGSVVTARKFVAAFFMGTLLSFWTLFALQRDPLTYYAYIVFPCYFWNRVFGDLCDVWSSDQTSRTAKTSTLASGGVLEGISIAVLVIVTTQMMVAAYTTRSIWSLLFVFIGVIWPLSSWPRELRTTRKGRILLLKWMFSCLATALFPLRDVEQGENLGVIASGGLALIGAAVLASHVLRSAGQKIEWYSNAQTCLSTLSLIVTADSVRRLTAKSGLPVTNQVVGWVLLLISSFFPVILPFRSLSPYSKLLLLFQAFTPLFIILSICAEGLFYLSFCVMLVLWVDVETNVRKARAAEQVDDKDESRRKPRRQANIYVPKADDVRIALFFLFFVQIAFFGTGNVASISSFYLEPVYRLVPIFSPFIMAALLIFKIIAPYVMLSATFALLNSQLGLPPFSLFMIALSITDGMTVTFFSNVTDSGSWLEIGQSISFFVITSLLLVWSGGICALGEWLMSSGSTTSSKQAKPS